ncbi:MAG: hypothetical protein WCJ24_01470 [Candidatus Saccharibacteria bacterium]
MKALILYHPKSQEARTVEDYARDFEQRKDMKIELLSLETREGSSTATLYDVMQYPALLVIDGDGRIQKGWQGQAMPLMDELAGYLLA